MFTRVSMGRSAIATMRSVMVSVVIGAMACQSVALADVVLLDSSGTLVQNFGSAASQGYHTDGPSGGSGGLAYSSSPINQAVAEANARAASSVTGDIIEIRDDLDYQYGGTPGDVMTISQAGLTIRNGFDAANNRTYQARILTNETSGSSFFKVTVSDVTFDGITMIHEAGFNNHTSGFNSFSNYMIKTSSGVNGLTVTNSYFQDVRAAIRFGGAMDDFTFTNNTVIGTTYSVVRDMSLGGGDHVISGNTFDKVGQKDAIGSNELGHASSEILSISDLASSLVIEDNIFRNYDYHAVSENAGSSGPTKPSSDFLEYALRVFDALPEGLGPIDLASNQFLGSNGGSGAPVNFIPHTTGYAVGFMEEGDFVMTPEPATIALLGLGGSLFGLFTRRRLGKARKA